MLSFVWAEAPPKSKAKAAPSTPAATPVATPAKSLADGSSVDKTKIEDS